MANPWEKYQAPQEDGPWAKYGAPAAPPAPAPTPTPVASMDADKPKGIADHVTRWARNVSDDIKYGTDITGIGTILKKMGAHGVYQGNPQQVGDYMASLPLGLLKVTEGAGEVGKGQVAKGVGDAASGALQAATIPTAFMGGPEASMAGHGGAATKAVLKTGQAVEGAAAKVSEMVPSAKRAGHIFEQVMAASKNVPINVNGPGEAALKIQELANAGGSMPKVARDFLKRVTDPDKAAMTYKEARDFYSNATRLSADEAKRLTPVMKREVAQFTANLGKAIEEAAGQTGSLDQYRKAMDEYHKAMRIRAVGQAVKDAAKNKLVQGAAAAAGAGAAGVYVGKAAFGGR